MATASLLAALAFLVAVSPAASSIVDVLRHLHFYLHEFNSDVPYLATSAHSVDLGKPYGFGDVFVYDDVVRTGQDPNSAVLGRAQGLNVRSNIAAISDLTALEFIFTAGEFNGSSFNVLGRVAAGAPSDRSIIGGTGRFRMARGYILGSVVLATPAKTIWSLDAYITLFN